MKFAIWSIQYTVTLWIGVGEGGEEEKRNTTQNPKNWLPQEGVGGGGGPTLEPDQWCPIVSFWPALTVYHIPCKPIEGERERVVQFLFVWDEMRWDGDEIPHHISGHNDNDNPFPPSCSCYNNNHAFAFPRIYHIPFFSNFVQALSPAPGHACMCASISQSHHLPIMILSECEWVCEPVMWGGKKRRRGSN